MRCVGRRQTPSLKSTQRVNSGASGAHLRHSHVPEPWVVSRACGRRQEVPRMTERTRARCAPGGITRKLENTEERSTRAHATFGKLIPAARTDNFKARQEEPKTARACESQEKEDSEATCSRAGRPEPRSARAANRRRRGGGRRRGQAEVERDAHRRVDEVHTLREKCDNGV